MENQYVENMYKKAIKDGKPEKIYWWEAIKMCRWQDIDKILEVKRKEGWDVWGNEVESDISL